MPLISQSLAGLLIATIPTSSGDVSPAIHKLCLEAKDYAGCVQSQTGKASGSGVEVKLVITNDGAAIAGGNSCPDGYAYIGGGYCKRVKCEYGPLGFIALGHDQLVAGKSKWGCKYNLWYGAGVMRLEDGALRAINNPNCPSGETQLGWNNTCETAPQGAPPRPQIPQSNHVSNIYLQ